MRFTLRFRKLPADVDAQKLRRQSRQQRRIHSNQWPGVINPTPPLLIVVAFRPLWAFSALVRDWYAPLLGSEAVQL